MANELKRKRRMEMGDKDPTDVRIASNDSTSAIPPQPMPYMEQGKGNLMNFRATDKEGQMGQMMGSGQKKYPYGDGGLSLADGRMGGVGFVENSGQPQNQVGAMRGLNQQPYNTVAQPKEGMSQEMQNAQYYVSSTIKRGQQLYASSSNKELSHNASPMGMIGTPVEVAMQGNVNPGQLPGQTPAQTNTTMPLTGNVTASVPSSGLNTGRGGGRNQKPQNA